MKYIAHNSNIVVIDINKNVKNTIEEKGCVEFFVTPSNLERGEFILWEIWKDREAFEFHHNAEHTKEFFSKKLTEIKWIEMDGEL